MVTWLVHRSPTLFLEDPERPAGPVRYCIEVSVRAPGRVFSFMARNTMHARRLRGLETRTKEPLTIQWLIDTVECDDVLYDIGANVGVFSILAAGRDPSVQVLAFEPEPQSLAALAETVARNKLNIMPLAVAMADGPRLGQLHLNTSVATGLSDHQIDRPISHTGQPFEPKLTIGIAIASVDYVVSQLDCPHPTHVKIDVDGQELAVVRGMERALRSSTLRWLAIESTRSEDARAIADLVNAAGFVFEPKYSADLMRFYRRPTPTELH
jgi:FkbM family methyltransferase